MPPIRLCLRPACLAVAPCRGVGRRLIATTEARARAQRCSTLILNVNKNNVRAIRAYEKNGFVIREAVVVDIGSGFVMDDFVMAKPL